MRRAKKITESQNFWFSFMPKERNKDRNRHASSSPVRKGEIVEDQEELKNILDSFASDRLARHTSQVQAHVDKLRDPESKLPAIGSRVLITANNTFDGRYGKVIGRDGKVVGRDGSSSSSRIVVQVEGQTDLCRLTLNAENVQEIVDHDASESEERPITRDFSDIHALAVEHARKNARRQVIRMTELAEERRKIAEQNMPPPTATRRQVKLGKAAYRQRCKFGADCGKPGCT
jgi:hypothetical protein